MKDFFEKAGMQNHPLRVLTNFLVSEEKNETAGNYDGLRFVGYVLDICYDTITMITSDPFKVNVGGVPRNSLLIMVPSKVDYLIPHFTLLRVLDVAPTPLSKEVQQTYFELHKKSMPELDIFTQSELQWGALKTAVLGMFYPHPEWDNAVEFSGDLNNFVSAHRYKVYAPDDELLDLIINSMVPEENRFPLGKLRLTECRLPLPGKSQPNVDVYVSTKDFMGTRTAMFGKTRLGKSNIVKLIAQSLIETTANTKNVGQIIFDITGEYANDNPQDDNFSLASAYSQRCFVYALTEKKGTPSKPLKLNFYEQPDRSHRILSKQLELEGRRSIYVKAFSGCDVPSLEDLQDAPFEKKLRIKRRILMYWAILKKGGFSINENELKRNVKMNFDPEFTPKLRNTIYSPKEPPEIKTLNDLMTEMNKIADLIREKKEDDPILQSSSGSGPLFERDDKALLEFLNPSVGAGPAMIQRFRIFHDPNASDFVKEILNYLNNGETVILDLGNADPEVMKYFSDDLTREIFRHQVDKFTRNALGEHYIQMCFEEAHNLFPAKETSEADIYRRVAKEGAKYHIGMVYLTQSVTTISKDLLAQTENFFIAHMSSQDEVNALAKVNVAYESLKNDILQAKTPGYVRMLTRSHRFVVPVQAKKFTIPENGNKG